MQAFLEDAYVQLADYLDDELSRVMRVYEEAMAALAADQRPTAERRATPAWRTVTETSRIAGDIAKRVVGERDALRAEFRAWTAQLYREGVHT